MVAAHRDEWTKYGINQVKKAKNSEMKAIRSAFASTSTPSAAEKKIKSYLKGPSRKVWMGVLKSIWTEVGHASIKYHHDFVTGKSFSPVKYINSPFGIATTYELKQMLTKDPALDLALRSWDDRVYERIQGTGFKDKITGINSTTEDRIHRTIAEGVDAGNSHYEIGQNVESHLEDTWAKRGETISRTEGNSAMNMSFLEDGKKTAPDLWKTWSIAGNNTRAWHEEMDGVSIPMDEQFEVDSPDGMDLMDCPGDDSAGGSNLINCECCLLLEEPPTGEKP
jgi:hypothetical protein